MPLDAGVASDAAGAREGAGRDGTDLAPDTVAPDRVASDRVASDRVAPDTVAPDTVADESGLRSGVGPGVGPGTGPGDATGLGVARALARDLSARARADPGRRSPSREAMARLAESAGLPQPASSAGGGGGGAGSDGERRAPRRSRPPPSAPGRVGGLGTAEPFTGPRVDPSAGSGDLVTLATAVDRVVGTAGGRERLAVHGVFGRWPELVGADVAAHSRPTGFDGGVLEVAADSSAWATQLRLLAPVVMAAVDRLLGAGTVTSVRVSGPARPSWRHGRLGLRDARGARDTYG